MRTPHVLITARLCKYHQDRWYFQGGLPAEPHVPTWILSLFWDKALHARPLITRSNIPHTLPTTHLWTLKVARYGAQDPASCCFRSLFFFFLSFFFLPPQQFARPWLSLSAVTRTSCNYRTPTDGCSERSGRSLGRISSSRLVQQVSRLRSRRAPPTSISTNFTRPRRSVRECRPRRGKKRAPYAALCSF